MANIYIQYEWYSRTKLDFILRFLYTQGTAAKNIKKI